jgi:prepilin-type N-terminal cleavage/methylation domain-containing protein
MKMRRLSLKQRFLAGDLLSKVNDSNGKAMTQKRSHRLAGFTLVEIMIVTSIIALLATIAVPGFLRARKRSQATRVLEDLRLIDAAVSQYAIEKSKASGTTLIFSDLQPYLKPSSPLYNTGKDILGHRYRNFIVDQYPQMSGRTATALSDVVDASFWSPYQ